MTIREYMALLDDIKQCQSSLEIVDRDLKQMQAKVVDLGAQYKKLIEQKNASLESVRNSIIAEEEEKIQAPIRSKISCATDEKRFREARYNSERRVLLNADYTKKYADSYTVVKHCNEVMEMCSKDFSGILSDSSDHYIDLDLSDVTISDEVLLLLANKVLEIAHEDEVELCLPAINRLFNRIFLPQRERSGDRKSSLSLAWLILKSACVIGLFAMIPIVIVAPYTFGVIGSIRGQTKNAVAMSDSLLPLAYLRRMTELRKEYMDNLCKTEQQQEIDALDAEFASDMEKLNDTLHDLEIKELQVRSQVLSNITDEDINARVNQQYSGKVKDAAAMREQAKNQNAALLNKKQELDTRLRNLRVQQAAAKKELENELIDLNHVGEDKTLLRSFFLGFDESGRIISLDYEGDTSLIMYSGADSSVVSPFVRMMIIQYFTNMLVNNLKIDIVDFENGGTEYDVFKQGNLNNVVSISTTDKEESSLIEELHADMRMRSSRISVCADNIDDYNRIMMERDSLTMEYRIVIFQAFSDSLCSNQKFLQLCRQGAKNGIIMFLFVNISSMPKLDSSKKGSSAGNDVKRWRDLIYAIPKQFFNFNSESGEVSALGTLYKTESLAELDKYISGV